MENKLSFYYGYEDDDSFYYKYKQGDNERERFSNDFSLSPLLPYDYKGDIDGKELSLGQATGKKTRVAMVNFYSQYYEYHISEIKKDIAGSVEKYDDFEINLKEVMDNFHKEFREASYKTKSIVLDEGDYNSHSTFMPSNKSLEEIEKKLLNIKRCKSLLKKIEEDLNKFETQINKHKDAFSLIEGLGAGKNNEKITTAKSVLGKNFDTISKAMEWIKKGGIQTQSDISSVLKRVGETMRDKGNTNAKKEEILRENEIWSVLRLITMDSNTLGGLYGELGISLTEVQNEFFKAVAAGGTNTVSKNNGQSTTSKTDIILKMILDLESEMETDIRLSLKAHPSVSMKEKQGKVSSKLVSSSVQTLFADSIGKTKDTLSDFERLKILNTLTDSKEVNTNFKNLLAYSHFIQAASGFKDDRVHIMLDSHKGWELSPDFINKMLSSGESTSSPINLTGTGNTFNKVQERIVNKIKNKTDATLADISVPLGFETRNMSYKLE